MAPSVARIPHRISPPSNAGPAGAAVATERSEDPHAISPLVPTSTSRRISGSRTNPVATMSATMSAPTYAPIEGKSATHPSGWMSNPI